jgi:uncharacterized protein YbjT (DUF2867 family)
MKSAIVFGASGFAGSHLLSGLLNSSDYGQVTAVARSGHVASCAEAHVFMLANSGA